MEWGHGPSSNKPIPSSNFFPSFLGYKNLRCGFQLITVEEFVPLAQDPASWRTEAFRLTASCEFGARQSLVQWCWWSSDQKWAGVETHAICFLLWRQSWSKSWSLVTVFGGGERYRLVRGINTACEVKIFLKLVQCYLHVTGTLGERKILYSMKVVKA